MVIENDGALEITGGQLDMQEFLKLPLAKNSSKKSAPIKVYLDELKLYEEQVITRFTAALEANGKGKFSGSLNDLASFDGDLERVKKATVLGLILIMLDLLLEHWEQQEQQTGAQHILILDT